MSQHRVLAGLLGALAASLVACERERPPAPDSDQQVRLDEAEAMLNDMAHNEKGAAPEDTAPSYSSSGAGAE